MTKIFKISSTLFLLLLFTTAIIFGAEIFLREKGFQPNSLSDDIYLKLVDSLYVRNDYENNAEGIFTVSSEKRELVNSLLKNNKIDSYAEISNYDLEGTISQVIFDFDSLNHIRNYGGLFGKWIDSLKSKNEPDEIDKAYLHYVKNPINEHGFRSIPFKNYESDKKKILLLGDSFTWGLSATPITNSFPDLLSSFGYIVFNTGIVGADPAQYAAVAEKYISLLEPDYVIVNFFMGNDQMYFYREVQENKPYNHVTNFGWINAYPKGCYKNVEEAYAFLKKQLFVSAQSNSIFARMCARSVLGTRFWGTLLRTGIIKTEDTKNYSCSEWKETPITEIYIHQIKKACERNNSKMILVLIPDEKQMKNYETPGSSFLEEVELNFATIDYSFPPGLDLSDYPQGAHHFNNKGSLKYANFLKSLIETGN